jgi:hypothetical protein
VQQSHGLGSSDRRIGDAFAAGFYPAGVALLVTGYAFDTNSQIVPSVIFAERNSDLGVRGCNGAVDCTKPGVMLPLNRFGSFVRT